MFADYLMARSTLETAITATSLLIQLKVGDGDKFPTGRFLVTLLADGKREVIQADSRVGDILTVTRAAGAQAFGEGACVVVEPTGSNFCRAVSECLQLEPVKLDDTTLCPTACTCITLTSDGRVKSWENPSC